MKVLVLTTTFPRWKDDPTPAFVYELSRRLRCAGLEIVVLAPHHEGAESCKVMEGLKVYRFPYFYPTKYQRLCYGGGMLPNLKNSWLARLQLPFLCLSELFMTIKIIKNEKIDLIHSHWIPNGFIGAICKKILRKPLIITVHGTDLIFLNNRFLRLLGTFALDNCDLCTVNSTATRNAVLEIKNVKKLEIIPMGVDLDAFNPQVGSYINKTFNADDLMILTVGRISEEKGIRYLIEAMPVILKEMPTVKLMIVGDGPDRDKLEQMVKRLNLANITFAGMVSNKNLSNFYKSADVFILPSIREGLGVVLLEAMACGTPVIGSNTGGVTDIIENGKNGLLIEPGDSKDIAEKIIKLLSNRELAQKLSEEGMKTVKYKFSWHIIVKKFLREFQYAVR
jgi:N-acetyl-alpha-D-glucosaminyl L-malate synthase BshA